MGQGRENVYIIVCEDWSGSSDIMGRVVCISGENKKKATRVHKQSYTLLEPGTFHTPYLENGKYDEFEIHCLILGSHTDVNKRFIVCSKHC